MDQTQTATANSFTGSIPPSFQGDHTLYMLAIFGSLLMLLLAANWVHRLIMCAIWNDPQPLRAPVTMHRLVIILILFSLLMRVSPKVFLLLQWPEISVATRQLISKVDRVMDALAIFPFFAAWMLAFITSADLARQLKGLPTVQRLPENAIKLEQRPPVWSVHMVKPSLDDLKRPAKIAAGCLAIAFAVVYLQ